MKLQTRLIGAFLAVAAITLVSAVLGFWQVSRLSSALYEVGVVRLPSLLGLTQMREASSAVAASLRVAAALPRTDPSRAVEEARYRDAWVRFDSGYAVYAPLPQTPEELTVWLAFDSSAKTWRAASDSLAEQIRAADLVTAPSARPAMVDRVGQAQARVDSLLDALVRINTAISEEAKAHSIASQRDVGTMRGVALASALLSVLAALAVAVLMARRVSRPIRQVATALTRVSQGEVHGQVDEQGDDELRAMARAMNTMVESLRRSEARIRTLSDNIPDSMVYQAVLQGDGSYTYRYVSAGVRQLHGISPEEALRDGSKIFGQFLPDERPRLARAARQSAATMTSFDEVAQMRRPDGEVRWVRMRAAPRRVEDGVVLWDGVELDVTVAKRAEEEVRELLRHAEQARATLADTLDERRRGDIALAQSEARFRSAMQNSPIGMAIVDLTGRWLEVNPALCAILGRTRDDLMTRTFQSLTHPDDVEGDLEQLRRAIAGEFDAWEREKRYRHADGHDTWVQMNVSLVRGDDGQPLHLVTQVQDITLRRQAEATLRAQGERHARFEQAMTTLTRSDVDDAESLPQELARITEVVSDALEVARVSIWTFDPRNASFTSVEVYDRRTRTHDAGDVIALREFRELDHLHSTVTDVLAWPDPACDPRARNFFEHVLVPLGIHAYMRSHIRSQGRLIGTLACGHAGGPRDWTVDEQSFLVSVSNLISARMVQAERLRAESQLRQAEKMNAVGQLAGGVAHDFNNLLTIINGCADLLRHSLRGSDPGLLELVSSIREAGDRAAGLTRQLLLFSRKARFEPRKLQLNDVLQGTLRLLHRLIGEDVVVEGRFDPDLRPVVADAGQLEQVVMNLAVNARDAMSHGGRLVISASNADYDEAWCATHQGYQPGAWVRLSVADSGTGMSPDVLEHIFEPFFTTKEAGKGTGLGLATVYAIVQQSGGFVTVESTVGSGTTFHVHLPALIATPVSSPPVGATAGDPSRGSETILLVEDEREVRRIAYRILTHHGYSVIEAGSGAEALQLLSRDPRDVHLVLTDMVMPAMNGRELVDALRVTRPRLKAIFMSGYSDHALLVRGDGSRESVLQKPFTTEKLAQVVREALDA